jgi:hypothetical protein
MKKMSAKFKNIITGDIVDNDNIMDKIESGHIDGEDYRSYRSACCDSEVFIKRKSERAREHFSSTHTEKCPDQVREYYIDSEGKEKYLAFTKIPSKLNLNFLSSFVDEKNKDSDGRSGEGSKKSKINSEPVAKALYILEKVVGSAQSIEIDFGDEKISSNQIIDSRGVSLKELTEECNDKYIFAEVKKSWYRLESDNRKATMSIVINAVDGSLRIALSDDIKSNTRPNHFNIEGKKIGKIYVLFKLRKYEKGAYSTYSSLRVATIKKGNGDSSKKKYKILGATIYSK